MLSCHRFFSLSLAALAGGLMSTAVLASPKASAFAATLSAKDRAAFESYIAAQTLHSFKLDKYWRRVEDKRAKRRRKKAKKLTLTKSDYVSSYPPSYSGPSLSKRLSSAWYKFRTKDQPKAKKKKKKTMADVSDFLANAKRYYGFQPERISEREFKRRYAREALRLGLTPDQVVRVYALETGGLGTADMQAGIHPIRKTGRPISSALGYAQLLAANTINELVKHGRRFIVRLETMAREANSTERRKKLNAKAKAVRKMYATAKSIPNKWSRQVKLSRTPRGNGMHVLNIDGDVGPWLQVIKLHGLKEMARRAGRPKLSSTEIELMNLAGPGTGLEMMRPAGLKMPTTNFFSRRGYYRNTIVRGKTSKGLMDALSKRMTANMKNSGAREFVAIFGELKGQRSSSAN